MNNNIIEPANLIIPGLWLGNIEAARNREFMKNNNIKLIINCSNDIPNYFNNYINTIRVPVDDSLMDKDFVIMSKYIPTIIEIIYDNLYRGNSVLVHCYAGMQRSACIVCAFLMYYFHINTYEAVIYIKSKRNIAFTPYINFLKSLIIFQKHIDNR
jgi:protein-tyrosine phosphatase